MTASTKTKLRRKRIYIVDDHPMMREGLSRLISAEKDLSVSGEAADASLAYEDIKKDKPDLVLIDITLVGKNGLELIKDIEALALGIPMLVISMHDESLYAERVLRAGARGYIMKQEGGEKIMAAIRKVLQGEIFVSEKISHKILEIFSGKKTGSSSPIESLTDREFEIFQLVGQGVETKEIAKKLNISVKTVEVHRTNIKEKLTLKSANELIRYAVRWTESQSRA